MIAVRTDSLNVIDSVFKHPEVEDLLFDDSPRDITYPIRDDIIYLALSDNKTSEVYGLGMFIRQNMISLDCHIAFLPSVRGIKAIDAGLLMIEWLRIHTGMRKLTAGIPDINKKCQRYAVSVGYEREGVNARSFLKNGIMYDQVYYGLEINNAIG